MLQTLQTLNLMLRFALELGILAALAVWAWRRIERRGLRLVAAVTLPLAAAVAWGTFVHGELVPSVTGVLVEIALFAAAAAALVAVRHPRLAAGFVGAVVVNAGLMAPVASLTRSVPEPLLPSPRKDTVAMNASAPAAFATRLSRSGFAVSPAGRWTSVAGAVYVAAWICGPARRPLRAVRERPRRRPARLLRGPRRRRSSSRPCSCTASPASRSRCSPGRCPGPRAFADA